MFIDCVRIDLHCADKQCIHVVFDACEMLPRLSADVFDACGMCMSEISGSPAFCILIVQPVHPVKSRTLCWSFDAVFFICGEGGVSELSGHPFGHILVCSEPSSGFPDKVCYVLRSKAILNTMQCSEYTQTKFILR